MGIQETLSKIADRLSDPLVSQDRLDQLQIDKSVATERILEELARLATKHNVPASDLEDVAAEVTSAVDTLTIEPETGYLEELGCRLDCIQSSNSHEKK
jgi:hypothetical protein